MRKYLYLVLILLFITACNANKQDNATHEEPVNGQENEEAVSISIEDALQIVRAHVSKESAKLEYSHQFEDSFVIHVYEDGAEEKLTLNWYYVDQETGDIVRTSETPRKVIGEVSEEVKSLAATIITALERKDMTTVATYVHLHKGVLFSPYLHIEENALVFSLAEVDEFFNTDTVFHWGAYDGIGTPIELTTEEYFNRFIYNANYAKADELVYDVDISRGNLINNFKDYFENSIFVEYYVEGTEQYGGMDWRSIHLVFDVSDPDEPKLIAIVNDEWTT